MSDKKKPYGSPPPNDPIYKMYKRFEKFHERQVDNHEEIHKVLKKQTQHHNQIHTAIDKIIEQRNDEIKFKHKLETKKWIIVALSVVGGSLFFLSVILFALTLYIPSVILSLIASYLIYRLIKEGSKPVHHNVSNIRRRR